MDRFAADTALLCDAPQMVARAYVHAQSLSGEPHEVLDSRLRLIDISERLLLAVFVAQHAGLRLGPGPALCAYGAQLGTGSSRSTSCAVEELARALVDQELVPEVRELVELYMSAPSEGVPTRTRFARQMVDLIDLRDHLLLSDAAAMPGEGPTADGLAQYESALAEVFVGLARLGRHPIFYAQAVTERPDGTAVVCLLRFAGQRPEGQVVTVERDRPRFPIRTPFLMLSTGAALVLAPLVYVARTATRQHEVRLLLRWDVRAKMILFPAADDVWLYPDVMAPEIAARLRSQCGLDGPPEIAGYRIEGKLGRGASGTVFLAREEAADGSEGRRVALKVFHPAARAGIQRGPLTTTCEMVANPKHAHVAEVYACLGGASPALAREYVQGEDLRSLVERTPLPPLRAVAIVLEILFALQAAHERDILHRAIRPSNVLVDRRGHARLIDFGVGAADEAPIATRARAEGDVLAFAAPEQLDGTAQVGPAADVYAVGRLLEYMIAGEATGLARRPGLFPAGLQAVIRKAIQRDLACRIATTTEFVAALEAGREGGWRDDAPVLDGDRLNGSYQVRHLLNRFGDGFAFCGTDLVSGAPVTLVLPARRHDAQARLRHTLRSRIAMLPPGHAPPCLHHTTDGILFAVIEGDDFEALVAAFGDRSVGPPPAPPEPTPVLRTPPTEAQ